MCLSKNGNIYRRVHCERNVEQYKMHKIECCEGGMQLAHNATKNVRNNYLNSRMKYIMVVLKTER